jgi:hypothetical protein
MALELAGNARRLSTRGLIAAASGVDPCTTPRSDLQELGEQLDHKEGGAWVARGVSEMLSSAPGILVVVDAPRTYDQVRTAKACAGEAWHVHLTADDAVLRERYVRRRTQNPTTEFAEYSSLRASHTEREIENLSERAEIVIRTDQSDPATAMDAVVRLLARETPR